MLFTKVEAISRDCKLYNNLITHAFALSDKADTERKKRPHVYVQGTSEDDVSFGQDGETEEDFDCARNQLRIKDELNQINEIRMANAVDKDLKARSKHRMI